MYRKFREVWTCDFSDMPADRQTDRHADRNTSHPSRGDVNSVNATHVAMCCQATAVKSRSL